MKAFDNHQMIFNTKDPNLIINVELDPSINSIIKSFITETYDLFLLAETTDSFQILQIDLDKYTDKTKKLGQVFKIKKRLDFSKGIVGDNSLKDFHVRASSAKAKIN